MTNSNASTSRLYKYIDIDTLMQMKSYDLRAKVVVESFISGLHRSPYHGISSQFSEYKNYVPGDDLRHLDWKLYARSDRYYIRRYEGETNLQCHILLDLSQSMEFSHTGWSKADYACTLAATLAYFIYGQRDAFGLLTFDDDILEFLPAKLKRGHFHHFLAALEKRGSAPKSQFNKALEHTVNIVHRKGLMVLISDMMMDLKGLEEQLSYLRAAGHEVLLFQVLDPVELSLDIDNSALFEDMESGEKMFINPESIRTDYLKKLNEHNLGVHYQLMNTREPLNIALAEFLRIREGGK
jgi:uncharacterized protein (DUF58 family)